jgi:pyridoxine 5-phosphate synthase
MLKLGVNIDHVATVRQARRTYEPDPVWAAVEAQLGGADGITLHLREDRRHIQDHDVVRIKDACHVKMNLEMAATDEMVEIACRVKPHLAMLVPEGRAEITTEGGLDVAGQLGRLKDVVAKLKEAGLAVSAFIDAEPEQIDAAGEAGFGFCEIHTGPYAHAFYEAGGDMDNAQVAAELAKVAAGGRRIIEAGMRFNAGHALNYENVGAIAGLEGEPGVCELHIGHAIVSRAIFVGLRDAVAGMKRLMVEAGKGRS